MRERNTGQSLVELALTLPLLLALILAIIDGALLIQGYLTVNHAAAEAARWAVTYQPAQGECMDSNQDGSITDESWPYCPEGSPGAEDLTEDDTAYATRRAKLIKLQAVESAFGLRHNDIVCAGGNDSAHVESFTCIASWINEPGMLGTQVWGVPSFEVQVAQEDHPGMQGLPVRVRVTHNIPLVVFGPLTRREFVQVTGSAEMINEGIQVGYGNQPPPVVGAYPTLPGGPGAAPPTVTPDPNATPTATNPAAPSPTVPPQGYNLELNFEQATNVLPEERAHDVAARVTTSTGQNVSGARVTFSTDGGSFSPSGTGTAYTYHTTGLDGWARTTIYANEPTTATIRAWLDYDGDLDIDGDEPWDLASKIWEISGPYIVVSNHNPEPSETIAIDVMDHDPANSYDAWWCTITGTVTTQQIATGLAPDAVSWDVTDVNFDVPSDADGTYRVESHPQGASNPCGTSPVARSSPINIASMPPDLHISEVTVHEDAIVAPGYPITLNLTVENLSPVPVTGGPFDLDVYLDLDSDPSPGQLGISKQWLDDLGPNETTVITEVVTVYEVGDHKVWAQVDTTNYIDEGDTGGEDNNVTGPIPLEMLECIPFPSRDDDFEDGTLGAQWTAEDIGSPEPGGQVEENGQLTVTANGSDIWNNYDHFRYLYQAPISGDFRMDLRVEDVPDTHGWSKAGLMVRETTASGSRHYSNFQTRDNGISRQYRSNTDGGSSSHKVSGLDAPHYLRILREEEVFTAFYSDDGENWIQQTNGTTMNFPDEVLVGIATTSHESSETGEAVYDDFTICRPTGLSSVPPPPPPQVFPPGLRQCTELLQVTGFEGNMATVMAYWQAGGFGAYQRTAEEFYRGSFSMRLHASLGVIPCSQYNYAPYLYQEVLIPTEVYSVSTFTTEGHLRVAKSKLECSPGGPDGDDRLYVSLQETDGTQLVTPIELASGSSVTGTWESFTVDLSDEINLEDYADATLRLYWNATHDSDFNGTYFYLDNLKAEVCTEWPVPDPVPGTATIGGQLSTIGEYNVPVSLPGTEVRAYRQGGEVLKTRSIQDGSYHFYNIEPGTYRIYAETWVGGLLKTATVEVTVGPDETVDGVNLLLQ